MKKEILDMMEKYERNLEQGKSIKRSLSDSVDYDIQDLTSEKLQLKLKIERIQESLEDYKKEDDYLGKSEYQRGESEKIYLDRIKKLEEEEKGISEKLDMAKTEEQLQGALKDKMEEINSNFKELGSYKSIQLVKEEIYRVEDEIDENNVEIAKLNKEINRLAKEPSFDREQYEEKTEKISELEAANEKLKEYMTECSEFKKKLEDIFIGKDPLKESENKEETEQEENKDEVKQEENKDEVKQEENKDEAKQEVNKVENKEEVKQEANRSTSVPMEQRSKQVSSTKEQKIGSNSKEMTKKSEIKVSAKDDCVYVNGQRINNIGIIQSLEDRKTMFKKLGINKEIKNSIGKSSLLKRIFVNPIIIAHIKAKLDPTIIKTINSMDDKSEKSQKIGEQVGLSISDYINSIRTKRELPVDLSYDLRESKLEESSDNKMQKYAKYADKITGVTVEGLKPKRSIFERLKSGITTSGLIEGETMAEKLDREYNESAIDIEEEKDFRDELKVGVKNTSVEPKEMQSSKEEKNYKDKDDLDEER